jgi:hypothetical protein
MADQKLAISIGTEVARLLHAELDEISTAVAHDLGQVSFSVTCVFYRDKEDNLLAKIEPRKRIPMPSIELKLNSVGGQLTLFE